jgi:hypothetical protein
MNEPFGVQTPKDFSRSISHELKLVAMEIEDLA